MSFESEAEVRGVGAVVSSCCAKVCGNSRVAAEGSLCSL